MAADADGSIVIDVEGNAEPLERVLNNLGSIAESALSSSMERLTAAVDNLAVSFQNMGANVGQLPSSIGAVGNSLEQVPAAIGEIENAIEAIPDAAQEAENSVDNLTEAVENAEHSMDELPQAAAEGFEDVSSESEDSADEVQGVWEKLKKNLAAVLTSLNNATDRAALGMVQGVKNSLARLQENTQKVIKNIVDGFKKLPAAALSGLGKITETSLKGVITGISAVSAGLTLAGAAAVKAGMEFETSLAKVGTIADTQVKSLDELSSEITEISNRTGASSAELNEALYQAISAGAETVGATELVETAVKAAAGGFTDTTTAVDGLTSALNAYGMKTDEAEELANKFLVTQNLGKTSFGELASSIGTVAPTANAAGVEIEELLSSVASLTANGIGTSEAMTGIKSALSNVIKPTAEAAKVAKDLGLDFSVAALQSKGFSAFLEDIQEKTGGNTETLSKLFGSVEGLNTILTLTSEQGSELMNKTLQEMETNTTALEDAYSQMTDTLESKSQIARTNLENLGNSIYDSVSEPLKDMADLGIESIGQLTAAFQSGGIEGLAESLGDVVSGLVLKITEMIPQVISAANSVITSFLEGVQANIGPITESGVAIAMQLIEGIGSALPTFFDTASQMITALLEGIMQNASTITDTAVLVLESLVRGILDNLPVLGEAAASLLISLADSLTQSLPELIPVAVQAVMTLVQGLMDNATAFIDAAIDLMLALADGLIDSIPLLLENLPQLIESMVQGLIEQSGKLVAGGIQLIAALAEGLVKAIPDLIKAIPEILVAIWNGLRDGLGGVLKIGKELIESLWEGMLSLGHWIKDQVSGLIDWIFGNGSEPIDMTSAVNAGKALGESMMNAYRKTMQASAAKGVKSVSEALNQVAGLSGSALKKNVQTVSKEAEKATKAASKQSSSAAAKSGVDYSAALAAGIDSGKAKVDEAVQGISDAAVNAVKEGAKDYRTAGSLYISSFSQGLKDRVNTSVDAVKSFVDTQVNALSQANENAADEYRTAGESVITAYTEQITANAEKATELVSQKLQGIADTAQAEYDNIIQRRDAMASKLADTKELFQISQQEREGNGFTETFTQVDYADLDRQYNQIQAYYDRLEALRDRGASEDFLSEIQSLGVEDAIAVMDDLSTKTEEEFTKFINQYERLQQEAKERAAKFYQQDLDSLKTGFTSQVTAAMNEIPGLVQGIGINTTQGFIDGVNSKIDNVSSEGQKVSSAVIDALKASLDIHSPSGVAEEMGAYTGEGFLIGLDGYAGEIGNSAYQIGMSAAQSLQAGFFDHIGPLAAQMQMAVQAELSSYSAHARAGIGGGDSSTSRQASDRPNVKVEQNLYGVQALTPEGQRRAAMSAISLSAQAAARFF